MLLAQAETLANELINYLRHGCTRIEIAGSVRRGKAQPKDIEIVCIANRQSVDRRDLWGNVYQTDQINLLDDALEHCMGEYGPWDFDTVTPRNGEKYKRLRHRWLDVCCDLFITTPAAWGTIYTIRTGPGEFSMALVTLAQARGWFVDSGLLHLHRRDFKIGSRGERVPQPCPQGDLCQRVARTPEERDFFEVLGVPWLAPNERTAAALSNAVKAR